jgi:cytochrome c oxidase subunit III
VAHTEAKEAHTGEPLGKLGVWLFLLTEVLLFGGLFILYAAYRLRFHGGFHEASRELDRVIGTANTIVLITSSLFVALAVHGLRLDKRRPAVVALLGAAALGLVFLVVKAFEWHAKFEHGLFPGSAVLAQKDPGEILFFGLYFVMTGLHALHVFVGIGVIVGAVLITRRMPLSRSENIVEGVGLYWHLVDVVWVFLFPLLYLIG